MFQWNYYDFRRIYIPGGGAVDDDRLTATLGRPSVGLLRVLADRERDLWIVLLGTVVADVILTYIGVGYLGAVEHNPLAVAMFAEIGIIATGVLLKAWLLVSLVIARTFVPQLLFSYVLAIPTALHSVIFLNNVVVITVLLL